MADFKKMNEEMVENYQTLKEKYETAMKEMETMKEYNETYYSHVRP